LVFGVVDGLREEVRLSLKNQGRLAVGGPCSPNALVPPAGSQEKVCTDCKDSSDNIMAVPYQCLVARNQTPGSGPAEWTLFGASGSKIIVQSSNKKTTIWPEQDSLSKVSDDHSSVLCAHLPLYECKRRGAGIANRGRTSKTTMSLKNDLENESSWSNPTSKNRISPICFSQETGNI
jgi:hypothetical protein